MAFKMKSHPEGPFSKNYGIKKGGHEDNNGPTYDSR